MGGRPASVGKGGEWLCTFAHPLSTRLMQMVVKVHNEAEIKRLLPIAKKLGVPVTFRCWEAGIPFNPKMRGSLV